MIPASSKVVKVRWTKDEDSCLHAAVSAIGARQWKTIAEHVASRNHVQCRQRWEKIAPGRVKGAWSWEEDAILVSRVNEQKAALAPKDIKWPLVAAGIAGRNAKQCKHRYCTQLDPALNKGEFAPEETAIMDELAKTMGRNWAQMSAHLPGRTPNMIKNYFKRQERKGRGVGKGRTTTHKRHREEAAAHAPLTPLATHTSLASYVLPPALNTTVPAVITATSFTKNPSSSSVPPSVSPLKPSKKKAKTVARALAMATERKTIGGSMGMEKKGCMQVDGKCIASVCAQLDELLDAVEQYKAAKQGQGKQQDGMEWLDSLGEGEEDDKDKLEFEGRDSAALLGGNRDSLPVVELSGTV
jgi:hypothetical protein